MKMLQLGFPYRDLCGSLQLGLLNYTRNLQEYAQALEEEDIALRNILSNSGNKNYLADAAEWGRKWNDLQRELGESHRERIEMEAELQAEIHRRDLEIEYLRAELEAYEGAEQPRSQRKRNSKTGRFVSDIPRKEKICTAADMSRKGFRVSEIAKNLNVTSETVKRYLREYENQWKDNTNEAVPPWE